MSHSSALAMDLPAGLEYVVSSLPESMDVTVVDSRMSNHVGSGRIDAGGAFSVGDEDKFLVCGFTGWNQLVVLRRPRPVTQVTQQTVAAHLNQTELSYFADPVPDVEKEGSPVPQKSVGSHPVAVIAASSGLDVFEEAEDSSVCVRASMKVCSSALRENCQLRVKKDHSGKQRVSLLQSKFSIVEEEERKSARKRKLPASIVSSENENPAAGARGPEGKVSRKKVGGKAEPKTFGSYLTGARGRVVVFDLETTGLEKNCEIVEIAARVVGPNLNETFNVHALPTGAIHCAASRVNGLRKVNGALHLNGKPVPSVSVPTALTDFVTWLETHAGHSPILVAHNCKRFDAAVLLNNLYLRADAETRARFAALDVLFGDSLPLFKSAFPGLDGYTLQNVFQAVFGRCFTNAHAATTDVSRLTDILFVDSVKLVNFGPFVFSAKSLAEKMKLLRP